MSMNWCSEVCFQWLFINPTHFSCLYNLNKNKNNNTSFYSKLRWHKLHMGKYSPPEASNILKTRLKWKHLLDNVQDFFFFFFFTNFRGRATYFFYLFLRQDYFFKSSFEPIYFLFLVYPKPGFFFLKKKEKEKKKNSPQKIKWSTPNLTQNFIVARVSTLTWNDIILLNL